MMPSDRSEAWVLEFVDFAGEQRRDMWYAMVNELICLYRFIDMYGPKDGDPLLGYIYGAKNGRNTAISSAIQGIARLQVHTILTTFLCWFLYINLVSAIEYINQKDLLPVDQIQISTLRRVLSLVYQVIITTVRCSFHSGTTDFMGSQLETKSGNKSGSFLQKALLKAILQSCLPNRNA
jgi:hypothetical protein